MSKNGNRSYTIYEYVNNIIQLQTRMAICLKNVNFNYLYFQPRNEVDEY